MDVRDHKKGWMSKNWCFWTVMLGTTLESPFDCKEIKPVLKEISPEYSLERLKLKHQYFGHLVWRANSLEKTLMLGKIEGRRRRGWQRMKWLDGIIGTMDMGLSKLREIVKDREAWHAAIHGFKKCQTWLSNWTITCYEIDGLQIFFFPSWRLPFHFVIFSFCTSFLVWCI